MTLTQRTTIVDLAKGAYDHAEHHRLADKGMRRYQPFSYDFDSTPLHLNDPNESWEQSVKALHLKNREETTEQLKLAYGEKHISMVIENLRALGPKGLSLISYHNVMHSQARKAFTIGAYYPALVSACSLGERILNHLILDLREHFKTSPHYRDVYNKDSFDNWARCVKILMDWGVLLPDVATNFLNLAQLRNRSIHFDPQTYRTMRDDALAALKLFDSIIAVQFGYFRRQPWFIENTPGAQFVKKTYETDPFVRFYIIPASAFVGFNYGMELDASGWRHLDYSDYGNSEISDDEFAKQFREREPTKVVTRSLIERQNLK